MTRAWTRVLMTASMAALLASAVWGLARPSAFLIALPLAACALVGVFASAGTGAGGLLAFVVSLAGIPALVAPSVSSRGPIVCGLAQLWIIWMFARNKEAARAEAASAVRREFAASEKELQTVERDTAYLEERIEIARRRSGRRRELAMVVRDLGGALSADQVQAVLASALNRLFPNDAGFVAGLVESDPVDRRLMEQHRPVLCEDLAADQRLRGAGAEPGTRSLMAAPLIVDRRVHGAVRVESREAGRFSREDLMTLDAVAALASLAFDNALAYHRIEQLATKDNLTGLRTHRAFAELLGEEILKASRYKYPVSLVMMDIDHFKAVNDTHGHAAGDDVLKRASALFAEAAGEVDAAARYGGEEFCLLLVNCGKDEAAKKAEALRLRVAAASFTASGRAFSVTASFGVAEYPADASAGPQLVGAADRRLYASKSGGRNRVTSA